MVLGPITSSPIFKSFTNSTTTTTLYEAKTTTTNNSPASSPTQWQSILTGTIESIELPASTTAPTPNTLALRDANGGTSFTNIQMTDSIQNNKLVLWSNSVINHDRTDFYGIGINGYVQRYQAPVSANHTFYTANTEVGNFSTAGVRVYGGLLSSRGSGGVTVVQPNVGAGLTEEVVRSVHGNALGGRISLRTGNVSPNIGLICIIRFEAGIYPNHVTAILTPGNSAASILWGGGQVWVDPTSRANQFWIQSGPSQALVKNTTYVWYYMCTGW